MSRAVSWVWVAACLLAAGWVLVACGNNNALLSAVGANPGTVQPTGEHPTEPIQLSYTLGRPATDVSDLADLLMGPMMRGMAPMVSPVR